MTLFDAMLAQGVAEYAPALRTSRAQVVILYEDNFNFLTKMCLAAMRAACCADDRCARDAAARV